MTRYLRTPSIRDQLSKPRYRPEGIPQCAIHGSSVMFLFFCSNIYHTHSALIDITRRNITEVKLICVYIYKLRFQVITLLWFSNFRYPQTIQAKTNSSL